MEKGSSVISEVAPLEAVLFDIDGTMCISDPFHHRAFSELLLAAGYNGGVPITPEFGRANMAGKSNLQIAALLFPDSRHVADVDAFFAEKEALFARYAAEGLTEVAGLTALCRWAAARGLKRAAVTNAPRANAELMIATLGLTEFFELIVADDDAGSPKPSPEPYLRALKLLGASPRHTIVFEDSVVGIQAGVAAGMPVIAVAEESREAKVVAAGASLVIRDYNDGKLWEALDSLDTAAAQPTDSNKTNGELAA